MKGYFASLTPEQQKAALDYRGPENHGDPNWALKMHDSEFKETRPPKLPRTAPKASDLVNRLLDDAQAVLGDRLTEADAKALRERFHTAARAHRHAIERFGKKWKKRLARIENTKAE